MDYLNHYKSVLFKAPRYHIDEETKSNYKKVCRSELENILNNKELFKNKELTLFTFGYLIGVSLEHGKIVSENLFYTLDFIKCFYNVKQVMYSDFLTRDFSEIDLRTFEKYEKKYKDDPLFLGFVESYLIVNGYGKQEVLKR